MHVCVRGGVSTETLRTNAIQCIYLFLKHRHLPNNKYTYTNASTFISMYICLYIYIYVYMFAAIRPTLVGLSQVCIVVA